ncbi:MAG: hypothetical protein ACFFBD_24130, partial [Candidatus Hodarchaeota archaeon]
DETMTQSHKGIYYKLTDLAHKHFGEKAPTEEMLPLKKLNILLEKSDKEITKVYVDLLAKHPDIGKMTEREKKKLAYNHILESIMLNNFERAENALKSGANPKNKNYPFGTLSNISIDMKISRPRHLFEIIKQAILFQIEMNKLNEKFKTEMDNDKLSEAERLEIHFHLVGGEIANFEFE